MPGAVAEALERLDELARRLRRDCPWDREQDERSIVPHTVEEAYELADAVHAGDDAKLLDELGDVLYQVVFLALLMEERGAGGLPAVAEHCHEKLVRRHPHVFGEEAAADADDVLRRWDERKRVEERGGEIFGELPETLPATLYARKVQRRADVARGAGERGPDPERAAARVREAAAALAEVAAGKGNGGGGAGARGGDAREAGFEVAGELLLAAVAAARAVEADPELALRAAAGRLRDAVERESGGGGPEEERGETGGEGEERSPAR